MKLPIKTVRPIASDPRNQPVTVHLEQRSPEVQQKIEEALSVRPGDNITVQLDPTQLEVKMFGQPQQGNSYAHDEVRMAVEAGLGYEDPSQWTPDPPQDKNSKRDTDQTRRFDKTQLRSQGYGYSVHRDYAAHFFRWGWAKKLIEPSKTVLDVGCGQDFPLARVLAAAPSGSQPALYVGCDYNSVKAPDWQWLRILDNFDFTSKYLDLLRQTAIWRAQRATDLASKGQDNEGVTGKDFRFDYAVNFEVIEHMHTCDGKRLFAAIYQCLKPGGLLFLSTPVFNGRAAANHIHEYTIPELQGFIEEAGFIVERRHGTFASYHEIKQALTPDQRVTLDHLRDFYDGDVAACFYAPMYPDYSRNNAWLCRRPL